MSTDESRPPQLVLAAALRLARERSGRTLRELQTVTYASDSALSRYLSGRSVPPWIVVSALCEAAGTDPGHLLPLWQRAKAEASARKRSGNEQATLARRVSALAADAAAVIQTIRERGEAVPENLLTAALRLSDAQRLISQE
ncbi:helix-turn-helix domain-containing protein [Actinoplanes sp. RD1]|uniref:helix-turn-helix domain-containing protein n=1 Tax=Actinoplanes sp. RD1 TaxID=3064538 RepID=UPI002741CC98|nr:helix-turn-helix domain-containing protein [Actinoplanes sp. RD1]